MADTAEIKKAKKKQDPTFGRKTQVAIWVAVITAAGTFLTTGVPDIIRLFSERPPLETVQDMLANQSDKLREAIHSNMEVLKKQQKALEALDALLEMQREEVAKLTGCVETVRDVVRDCCTRRVRDVGDKLVERSKPTMGPPAPTEVMKILVHDDKPKFKKVPELERPWQQQQQQMQEPDK